MKHKKRCITMYIAWFVVYISLDAVHAKEQQVDSHQDSLLKQAIKYRDKPDATVRELKIAVGLLKEAAGLVGTRTNAAKASKRVPVPGFPDLQFADNGLPAALRELAKCYQRGKGADINHKLSLELFRRAAELGDPESQGALAVRTAVGLHHTTSFDGAAIRHFARPDEQAAILNYYFAAANGDNFARVALGYRHTYGLGVPKSCWSAVSYYKPVAEAVVQEAIEANIQGPLGSSSGRGLPQIERIRLNVHANQGIKPDRQREVLQYYQYSADRGNIDAQTAVGTLLNFGLHGVNRDHVAAAHYLQRAAAAGNAEAQAHLGHMYGAGLGVAQDFKKAKEHFEESRPHASAMYGLGYMYLSGKGVEQNFIKAFDFFSKAAEQGDRDALFYLGVMYMQGLGMKRRSTSRAFLYYSQAAKVGHVQAMYNTAVMHLAGKGTVKACQPALEYLKLLVEKGPLAATLQAGHEAFFRGHHSQALLLYLQASEMGIESAQSNAAWMLDRGFTHTGPQAAAVATVLFKRSAEQGNVMSLLQLGDCYYYGSGVEQDWVRASAIYYEAYKERSAEAMFNLGFMHEFGAGVPQDLDLARRFYGMAKHSNADAALPVFLARSWLRLHVAWNWLRPMMPAAVATPLNWLFVLRPATSSAGAARLVSGGITGGSSKWDTPSAVPALAPAEGSPKQQQQQQQATRGEPLSSDGPAPGPAAGKDVGTEGAGDSSNEARGPGTSASGGSFDGQADEDEEAPGVPSWLWWLLPLAPARLVWQWDSLMWRIAEATGFSGFGMSTLMEKYSDIGETVLLLVLLAVLVLVLRIRRQRQQALENQVLAALQQPGEQQRLAQQIAAQMGMQIPAQQQSPPAAAETAASAGRTAADGAPVTSGVAADSDSVSGSAEGSINSHSAGKDSKEAVPSTSSGSNSVRSQGDQQPTTSDRPSSSTFTS